MAITVQQSNKGGAAAEDERTRTTGLGRSRGKRGRASAGTTRTPRGDVACTSEQRGVAANASPRPGDRHGFLKFGKNALEHKILHVCHDLRRRRLCTHSGHQEDYAAFQSRRGRNECTPGERVSGLPTPTHRTLSNRSGSSAQTRMAIGKGERVSEAARGALLFPPSFFIVTYYHIACRRRCRRRRRPPTPPAATAVSP